MLKLNQCLLLTNIYARGLVAKQLLKHIILQVKAHDLKRLSLEVGSQAFFQKGHCTLQNL